MAILFPRILRISRSESQQVGAFENISPDTNFRRNLKDAGMLLAVVLPARSPQADRFAFFTEG